MPCSSDGYPRLTETERVSIASWCAILTVLEQMNQLEFVLNRCDWNEAGVSKEEVLVQWAAHKRRDAERRREEQARRDRKALRKSALSKLTPEEREALKNRW